MVMMTRREGGVVLELAGQPTGLGPAQATSQVDVELRQPALGASHHRAEPLRATFSFRRF